jgi:hypothetical protein
MKDGHPRSIPYVPSAHHTPGSSLSSSSSRRIKNKNMARNPAGHRFFLTSYIRPELFFSTWSMYSCRAVTKKNKSPRENSFLGFHPDAGAEQDFKTWRHPAIPDFRSIRVHQRMQGGHFRPPHPNGATALPTRVWSPTLSSLCHWDKTCSLPQRTWTAPCTKTTACDPFLTPARPC